MNTPQNIVLLGLGYVSVWAYKNLMHKIGRQIKNGEVKVTVISMSDYHAFHGFTGEFLAGMLPVSLRRTPQEVMLKHAQFVHGKALFINQEKQTVSIQNFETQQEEAIAYDHLVVGVGSVDNESVVPGIKTYGLGVKKENGIAQCRSRIISAIEMASYTQDERTRDALLSFAVVGGGFAGVEVCGNLCEYLRELSTVYPILKKHQPKIYLIHSGEKPLPQLAEGGFNGLIKYCVKQLEEEDVQILSQARLKKIKKTSFELDNGMTIPSHTVISCIGQQVITLDAEVPFETDAKGRMETTRHLNAQGYLNIWAGGDAARVMHVSGKKECRSDALWAIKQGRRIGRNIARSVKGQRPLKFNFPGMGQTASLSKDKAILELYGLCFKGRLAWWIRLGFFLYYMPHSSQRIKAIRAFMQPRRLWELEEVSHQDVKNTVGPHHDVDLQENLSPKGKSTYPILSNPV